MTYYVQLNLIAVLNFHHFIYSFKSIPFTCPITCYVDDVGDNTVQEERRTYLDDLDAAFKRRVCNR